MTSLQTVSFSEKDRAVPTHSVLEDESIHQWYQIIMGFDWKLVQHLIERFQIGPDHLVLDPFCGAGTTLVQCKKRGISSVGIDANPVCTLASKVKTSWHLNPERLTARLRDILDEAEAVENADLVAKDPGLDYLQKSGMIVRGWLSLHKAKRILAVSTAIKRVELRPSEAEFFHLALVSAVVNRIADIKFGPEVYCLENPKRTPVIGSFVDVAESMIADIEKLRGQNSTRARSTIFLGDSRQSDILKKAVTRGADFVITSPPYPAEHDYTRSTRLELILLGHVQSTSDLRPVKQRMVRCHTKGIYKDDCDAIYSCRYPAVQRIARSLDWRARTRTDGFSRLYGRMVREYFGGMICHLRQTYHALKPGGKCAYVVRDQQSLLGLYIDTPKIIAQVAQSRSQGFRLEEVVEWKRAKGSTGIRTLTEKIVILKRPH